VYYFLIGSCMFTCTTLHDPTGKRCTQCGASAINIRSKGNKLQILYLWKGFQIFSCRISHVNINNPTRATRLYSVWWIINKLMINILFILKIFIFKDITCNIQILVIHYIYTHGIVGGIISLQSPEHFVPAT